MVLSADREDEFVFMLQPLPTGRADLIAADLPGPLAPSDSAAVQVMVTYRNQGRLFTGQPGAMEAELPDQRQVVMNDSRHRLRFFGILGDRGQIGLADSGYIAVIDENADANIVLRQADDGALTCSTIWAPSMGTLAYTRTVRYRFQARPTAATLARGFREYAQSAGLYKSLKDKIAERPVVGRLIGATACFIGYEASDLDYVGAFRRLRQMGHSAFYAFPTYHINHWRDDTFAGLKMIDIRHLTDELRSLGAVTGRLDVPGGPDRPARAESPGLAQPRRYDGAELADGRGPVPAERVLPASLNESA